jgi:hypothetical protein
MGLRLLYIDGAGWSRQIQADLPPRKMPGTHCTGSWVGHGVGLDGYGIFRATRKSTPYSPAPSNLKLCTNESSVVMLVLMAINMFVVNRMSHNERSCV